MAAYRSRRDVRWAAIVWATVLSLAVVVLASAWLRLGPPGPHCDTWPTCRALDISGSTLTMPPDVARFAGPRTIHRVAASGALVLVLGLVALSIGGRSRRRHERRSALVLLGLALGLAVLGVAAGASRSPAVVLGNLLGGFTMFTLAWGLALDVVVQDHMRPLRVARATAVLWLLQVMFGGLAGLGNSFGVALLHVVLAPVVVIMAVVASAAARHSGRRGEGNALLLVVCAQIVLGVAGWQLAAAAELVHLHNAGAASGLALLWGLSREVGPVRGECSRRIS